ncbi:MAG: metallophosphoesterase family protein [Clostridia bacterium]|nr:metallophosphoesterase family protein [Clostridia bacterium]
MKLLVISDVHSNVHALHAIEQQEGTWDAVLFAGDMIDFGLQPHEVVCWMRDHNVIAVAGNHDTGLAAIYNNGFLPLDDPLKAESFCHHNLSVLTKEDMEYVAALPLEVTVAFDGITYFMTHIYDYDDCHAILHHLEKYDSIDTFESYWLEKVGKTEGKRCLILGDSHHCMMLQLKKDTMVINPGAAGYNLGADSAYKGASYIVIEDGIPYFKWADYDTSADYQAVLTQMTKLEEWQRATGLAIFKPEK